MRHSAACVWQSQRFISAGCLWLSLYSGQWRPLALDTWSRILLGCCSDRCFRFLSVRFFTLEFPRTDRKSNCHKTMQNASRSIDLRASATPTRGETNKETNPYAWLFRCENSVSGVNALLRSGELAWHTHPETEAAGKLGTRAASRWYCSQAWAPSRRTIHRTHARTAASNQRNSCGSMAPPPAPKMATDRMSCSLYSSMRS